MVARIENNNEKYYKLGPKCMNIRTKILTQVRCMYFTHGNQVVPKSKEKQTEI